MEPSTLRLRRRGRDRFRAAVRTAGAPTPRPARPGGGAEDEGVRRHAAGATASRGSSLRSLAALLILWAFLPGPVPVDTAKVSKGPLSVTVEEEGKTRLRDRFVGFRPGVRLRGAGGPRGRRPRRERAAGRFAGSPLRAESLDPRSRATAEARVAAAEAALRAAEARAREADGRGRVRAGASRPDPAADGGGADAEGHAGPGGIGGRGVPAPPWLPRRPRRKPRGTTWRQARAALTRGGKRPAGGEKVGRCGPRRAGRVMAVARESEGVVSAGTPCWWWAIPGSIEVEVDVLSADAVRIRPGHPGALQPVGRRGAAGREGPRGGADGVHEGLRAGGGGAAGAGDRGHHFPPGGLGKDRRRVPAGGGVRPVGGEGGPAGPGGGRFPGRRTGTPSTRWRRGGRGSGTWRWGNGTGSPPRSCRGCRKGRRSSSTRGTR